MNSNQPPRLIEKLSAAWKGDFRNMHDAAVYINMFDRKLTVSTKLKGLQEYDNLEAMLADWTLFPKGKDGVTYPSSVEVKFSDSFVTGLIKYKGDKEPPVNKTSVHKVCIQQQVDGPALKLSFVKNHVIIIYGSHAEFTEDWRII